MNIKRFIIACLVTGILFLVLDILFGVLGGHLTAAISGSQVPSPSGIESKMTAGFVFEVINAFILVLVFSVIKGSLPGQGWVKGVSYGLIVWALRVVMWAFSSYMIFDAHPTLLVVTAVFGLAEVLILCIVIAIIYKDS